MAKHDVRYGGELRKRYNKVEGMRTAKYVCPRCGKKNVKRKGNAQWQCRSCEAKIAGGAYVLSTPAGESSLQTIRDLKQSSK
ncbi:50S ribosomal protein L37Ae [Candidatus Gugararchaeum adminiculabundum]|nr:50S ribosomal protein L37Ae [Candidatus Gugararchaeum adminiculabundum]